MSDLPAVATIRERSDTWALLSRSGEMHRVMCQVADLLDEYDAVLGECIEWDSHDESGEPALWLERAEAVRLKARSKP